MSKRASSLRVGDVLDLDVLKPAAGGRMIARHDGQVLFVAGAVPGERVRARVERTGRGVTYAAVSQVLHPSPDRRAEPVDLACGGCAYAHITPERQRALKAEVIEDALTRIGRLTVPPHVEVVGGADTGYRMRARLHVRRGTFGFFREGTHDLCDVRGTRQLLPETCDVLDRVAAGLRSLGVSEVTSVELAENVDASARVIHLDAGRLDHARTLHALGVTDGVTGMTLGASAIGPEYRVVAGDPWVRDTLRLSGQDVTIRRHVLTFFQGNRFLLRPLLERVAAEVRAGDRVVDLYAGVGVFSVAAAAAGAAAVHAVEGDMAGAADLAENAQARAGLITTAHASVESAELPPPGTASLVIVDPPRTGMSPEALSRVAATAAPRLVYVSCDPATLARDAQRLQHEGYTVTQVDGFDLFPNTPHVETVAVFTRR